MTLAESLRSRGADCTFVCREHPGHQLSNLRAAGHRVFGLPVQRSVSHAAGTSAVRHVDWLGNAPRCDADETRHAVGDEKFDWLIVDHYGIDQGWTRHARSLARRVLVLDDLADRRHDADVLLDQNLYPAPLRRYQKLVPASCRMLLGPKFALLRSEFRRQRNDVDRRGGPWDGLDGDRRRLLIFLGGMDAGNVTARVLKAFETALHGGLAAHWDLDVVAGGNNPHHAKLRVLCERLSSHTRCNAQLAVDVTDMASRLASADLAITAGGGVTWERCCLGVPAGVITVADNQIESARWLHQRSVCRYLGDESELDDVSMAAAIGSFLDASKSALLWDGLRRRSSELVDGQGAERVGRLLSARLDRLAA